MWLISEIPSTAARVLRVKPGNVPVSAALASNPPGPSAVAAVLSHSTEVSVKTF